MAARFDHLVISVPDLEDAVQRWNAAGLPPAPGGRHPGGTINALVRGPGAAYVELISTEPDADSAWAAEVRRRRGPLGLALAVDDLGAARDALLDAGFAPGESVNGSRTTPNGDVIRWRTCQVGEVPFDPELPFLIEWIEPMAEGPSEGPIIEAVSVHTDDRERLAHMLRAVGLPERPTPLGVTFDDGSVQIALPTTADEIEEWTSWDGGFVVGASPTASAPGPTSVSFGTLGEPTHFDIDGLGVDCHPDVRAHRGHVLLPSVEAEFVRLAEGVHPWPDPHPDRQPREEEYSRCLEPAKYRLVTARVRAWAAALEAVGLATLSGGLAITPTAVGAVTIDVLIKGFEGLADNLVEISAGDILLERVPGCGWDACDSGSADLLDQIDRVFLQVLDGGVGHGVTSGVPWL